MVIQNIASLQTVDFVKTYLPEAKCKILEVGCGKGDLAVELKKAGYFVAAIDKDPDNIKETVAKDVPAQAVDLLEYNTEDTFDAVLFTHSLHHIHQLDAALKKAKSLLTPKGKLLIEDFSLELVDANSADWFYEMLDFVELLSGNGEGGEKEVIPLDRWKKTHEHEPRLHLAKDMLQAIERNFETSHVTTVPYLYRYFARPFAGFEKGDEALKRIFDWEQKRIEEKKIPAIGLRVVAKKHFSYLK